MSLGTGIACDYVLAPRPEDNDAVLAQLAPGSLGINATGLGKDAPGSPLTDAGVFPSEAIAWELNYRGELVFLDQARRDATQVEDGWTYFIHGWTQVIAEVFDIAIPTHGPVFDEIAHRGSGDRAMRGRILITPRSLSGDHIALAPLTEAGFDPVMPIPGVTPSPGALARAVPGCVGWLAGVEPIPAEVINKAESLRVFSRNRTGIDNLPMPALEA
jgi:hypothetical protein